jgi:hypothetical protein
MMSFSLDDRCSRTVPSPEAAKFAAVAMSWPVRGGNAV